MNWWENDLPSGASSGTDRVSQFTATYRPLAEKIGQELGVSPDILLAKFGSETGWGKSVIPGTNNLGNIKDPSGRGVYATDNMTKSRDAYRVFDTPESFGDYYTAFIKRSYPKAVGAGSDPMAFAQGLKEGVRGSYAEDPQYGPKIARATNMVTKGNAASDAGAWWSNDLPAAAPASGGEQWWANDLPAAPATTQAAPKAATAPTPEKKKDEPRSVMRRVDDFVRGVADTVTFGYADEFAAKMDALVGGGQSGKTNYKDAVTAQRERDTQGGAERIAGQVTGAFVPGAAAVGVVRAVPTAGRLARAGAGAATGAIQGGLYGSGSAEEGQRLEGAAQGAAFGAATGGVLGGVLPATVGQKADDVIRGAKKKGTLEELRIQSEIAQDFKKVSQNPNLRDLDEQGLPTIAAALRNTQNDSYVDNVVSALKRVEPSLLKRFDVETALKQEKIIGPESLQRMRSMSPNGELLADSIQKYQIARTMTAPTPASGSLGAKVARFAITNTPRAAAAAAGASSMGPMGLALGAITPGAKGFAERVTGKMTVPERIEKLAKNADVYAEVLKREGRPELASRVDGLFDAARKAEQAAAAQKAAAALEKANRASAPKTAATRVSKATDPKVAIADLQGKDPTYLLALGNRLGAPRNATEMAEFSKVMQNQMEARAQKALANREVQKTVAELAKGPKVDPRIQVLQDSRRPLSGAFQELLPGGRSGLNMNSGQAIDALRLTSRQFKERPLGQAAQDILRSGNVADESAFYGLQNQLRKLQEQGVLAGQPGALTAASSGVRNPVSYAEAVRTAGEAANLARASAPSKELAQFATKVAGIKSPADKAKAVADRLAKSSDPAEQAFLTQFVEPLAQFGKK